MVPPHLNVPAGGEQRPHGAIPAGPSPEAGFECRSFSVVTWVTTSLVRVGSVLWSVLLRRLQPGDGEPSRAPFPIAPLQSPWFL